MKKLLATMVILAMAATAWGAETYPSGTQVAWDMPTEDVSGNLINPDNIKCKLYLKEKVGNAEPLVLGETKDPTWFVLFAGTDIFYNLGVSAFGIDDDGNTIANTESDILWSDSTDTTAVPVPFEFMTPSPPPPPVQYKPPTNLHVGNDSGPELITLQSGGGDVWGNAFNPTWVSNPVTGDFDFYAKVITNDITESYRQAGICYHHQNGDSVLVLSRYDGTVRKSFQRRDTVNNGTAINNTAQDTGSAPSWLRMERVGDKIMTYYATTEPSINSDWTVIAPANIEFSGGGEGELGVMAVNPGSTTFLAQFDFKPWQ